MAGKKPTRAPARTDAADAMPADDRRSDLPEVAGATTPKIDGGNA